MLHVLYSLFYYCVFIRDALSLEVHVPFKILCARYSYFSFRYPVGEFPVQNLEIRAVKVKNLKIKLSIFLRLYAPSLYRPQELFRYASGISSDAAAASANISGMAGLFPRHGVFFPKRAQFPALRIGCDS